MPVITPAIMVVYCLYLVCLHEILKINDYQIRWDKMRLLVAQFVKACDCVYFRVDAVLALSNFSTGSIYRVPMHPGKSWNFFVQFPTWKVLENDFGSGKFWKFKLKVLESAGTWMQ